MSQVTEDFLRFVKFAGVALLLFLTWGVWKEIGTKSEPAKPVSGALPSPWRSLGHGVMMIFLSPDPYLFWGLCLDPTYCARWITLSGMPSHFWRGSTFSVSVDCR